VRNAYKASVGNFIRRGHFAYLWSRCRWEDNIKHCVQETSCQNVDFSGSRCCPLEHSREHAGPTVPPSHQPPKKAWNKLPSWETYNSVVNSAEVDV